MEIKNGYIIVIPCSTKESHFPELFAWIERVMKSQWFLVPKLFLINDMAVQIVHGSETSQSSVTDCKGIKFRHGIDKSPALYYCVVQKQAEAMWSLLWMQICKTVGRKPELYRMITEGLW